MVYDSADVWTSNVEHWNGMGAKWN